MGSRQSTANSPSRMIHNSDGEDNSSLSFRNSHHHEQILSNTNRDWQRARSLTGILTGTSAHGNRTIQQHRQRSTHLSGAIDFSSTSSQDISNLHDDNEFSSITFTPHSLPLHNINHLKCFICSKTFLQDDIECHYLMCITKPPLSYNEDILTEDKGECVICLDDMLKGNKIARLPCLCIYHKVCIDAWFNVNRSCPEHPVD